MTESCGGATIYPCCPACLSCTAGGAPLPDASVIEPLETRQMLCGLIFARVSPVAASRISAPSGALNSTDEDPRQRATRIGLRAGAGGLSWANRGMFARQQIIAARTDALHARH